MAETATEETSETEEQTTEEQAKPEVPPEVQRALKKANKEAETLRLKLKEFEDKDKSESDKLNERLAAAESRAAELEVKNLRASVGADKGLPRNLWNRLQGSTEEEMAADADALLEVVKPKTGAGSFDAGAKETAPGAKDDMNSFLAKAIKNRR